MSHTFSDGSSGSGEFHNGQEEVVEDHRGFPLAWRQHHLFLHKSAMAKHMFYAMILPSLAHTQHTSIFLNTQNKKLQQKFLHDYLKLCHSVKKKRY